MKALRRVMRDPCKSCSGTGHDLHTGPKVCYSCSGRGNQFIGAKVPMFKEAPRV